MEQLNCLEEIRLSESPPLHGIIPNEAKTTQIILRKGGDPCSGRASQQVQEHMKAHIPNRSWSAHCGRGRRRNDPHRTGGVRRGPRDHFYLAIDDYGFLKANNLDPAD